MSVKRFETPMSVIGLALAVVGIQQLASLSGREFYLTQLIMSAYYVVVVLGLCLVMGYAGQVSLGHGAFFAIGGYCSAFLTTCDLAVARQAAWGQWLRSAGVLVARPDLYGQPILTVAPWAAFVTAMAVTFVIALLIGYPSLRLKGHYLAMATLGFGLIVYRLVLGSQTLGAADGINGVPPWTLGPGLAVSGEQSHRVANYYIAWGFALAVMVVLLNLTRSRVGRALRSIHDGELAANAMGIDTASYKLRAFVLSAMLAAAAGCLLTHYNAGIGPSEAGALKSVRYVSLVAAGGMANLWGTLTVSTVLTFLSLRGCFGSFDDAVFGIILIVIVALAPEGPLKPAGEWARRLVNRGSEGRVRRGAA